MKRCYLMAGTTSLPRFVRRAESRGVTATYHRKQSVLLWISCVGAEAFAAMQGAGMRRAWER